MKAIMAERWAGDRNEYNFINEILPPLVTVQHTLLGFLLDGFDVEIRNYERFPWNNSDKPKESGD